MKKILSIILLCMTVICLSVGVACSSTSNWKKPTLVSPGNVIYQNGFIAKTDNYVYFINGTATASSDNTFGAPVKGSLVAVENFGKDNQKAEIIVPKLFATEDYNSGFYISNGYVYYGTPCTDKASDGSIDYNSLTFMRTSLDGKTTDKFITVSSLSYEYRFIEKDSVIYIVYIDTENSAIVCYNTSTKTSTTIAEQDDEVSTTNNEGNYETLDASSIKFVGNTVVYLTKVYTEDYSETKASKDDYSRQTAKYNSIYTYNVGSEPVEVFNGSGLDITYSLFLSYDNYLFYKTTDIYSTEKMYGVEISKILTPADNILIKNTDNVASTNIIEDFDTVYTLDTEGGFLYKTSLTENEMTAKSKVAIADKMSTLLLVKDGDVYYFNSDNKLCKKQLNNENANEIILSTDTVNLTWYDPQILTIESKDYIIYCNNSVVGSEYIYYTDLSLQVIEEDTDDDEEADLFYLDGNVFVGIMTDKDKANEYVNAINKIYTELELEEEDGVLYSELVNDAQEILDSLTDDVKEYISDDDLQVLENGKTAVKLANAYKKLAKDYANLTTDQKTALKSDTEYMASYNNALALRDELCALGDNGKIYEAVEDLVPQQYKYYFQQADSIVND